MEVFVQDAAGQRQGMVVKEQDTLAEVVKEAERVLNYEVKECTELWYDGAVVAVAGEGGGGSFCGLTGISAGEDVQAVYSNAKLKERVVAGEISLDANSPDVMRGDAEIALLVAQHSPGSLKHALPSLRGDKGFMLATFSSELVNDKATVLRCATPELLDDAGFAADIIKKSCGRSRNELQYFSRGLQADARLQMLQRAVTERLLPDAVLSDDTEIAMLQISIWPASLQHVSERLQGDKEFVLVATKIGGTSLRYAAEHLRNDPDVVRAAVQSNGLALRFVPGGEEEPPMNYIYMKRRDLRALCKRRCIPIGADTLKPKLVTLLMEHDKEKKDKKDKEREQLNRTTASGDEPPAKKQKIEGPSLRSNEEIVLMAVKRSWEAVSFATGAAKESKEVALVAVQNSKHSFDLLSERLRGDKEVAIAMVSADGHSLNLLSRELKKDKSVVLAAVKKNGAALKYVKNHFGDDKDVALVACMGGGWHHISDRLKEDKEVAMRAVVYNGRNFSKLSTTLRNDKDVALVAVKRTRGALEFLGEDLRKSLGRDLEFAMAAIDSVDSSCFDERLAKLRDSVLNPTTPTPATPPAEGDNQ